MLEAFWNSKVIMWKSEKDINLWIIVKGNNRQNCITNKYIKDVSSKNIQQRGTFYIGI